MTMSDTFRSYDPRRVNFAEQCGVAIRWLLGGSGRRLLHGLRRRAAAESL